MGISRYTYCQQFRSWQSDKNAALEKAEVNAAKRHRELKFCELSSWFLSPVVCKEEERAAAFADWFVETLGNEKERLEVEYDTQLRHPCRVEDCEKEERETGIDAKVCERASVELANASRRLEAVYKSTEQAKKRLEFCYNRRGDDCTIKEKDNDTRTNNKYHPNAVKYCENIRVSNCEKEELDLRGANAVFLDAANEVNEVVNEVNEAVAASKKAAAGKTK